MKILPLQTLPPNAPTVRRHTPRPVSWVGGYSAYRECLRWDFGFTCAFCLLHDADIVLQGVDGLGVSTAEHLIPQSTPDIGLRLANDYTNIVYACRFCNTSRSDNPVAGTNGSLLDPTQVAWADHFQYAGDHLLPCSDGDVDATYTYNAYDLGDDRKIDRRKFRREVLGEYVELVSKGREALKRLMDKAQTEISKVQTQGSTDKILFLIEKAKNLQEKIRQQCSVIKRFSFVPSDAPTRCHCNTTEGHCLPDELLRQAVDIEDAP